MAKFTINIEEEVILPPDYWGVITNNETRELCPGLVETFSVKLKGDGVTEGILRTYVGAPWAELRILSSAVDSPLEWDIYYNGIPLSDYNSDTDDFVIPVTGLVEGDIIPNLEVKANISSFDSSLYFYQIAVSFRIKDINGRIGKYRNAYFKLSHKECTTALNPTITNQVEITPELGAIGDSKAYSFTIVGDPSTTYNYEIATIDNGVSGYTGILKNTDTSLQIYPNSSPSSGSSATGSYTTDGSGNINLSYEVYAKSNPGLQNCVNVRFSLYKADGIIINTTQFIGYTPCNEINI